MLQEFKMSDRVYTGANPVYTKVTDPTTGVSQYVKVARGIPFRRVR